MVAIVDGGAEPSELTMKNFFAQFHDLYTDVICDPFHTVGEPITSHRCGARQRCISPRVDTQLDADF
jgi:hypothetical protein